MGRPRFHIGGLLILVVLLGVGFAALREANALWDGIVLSSAVVLLLVSVLLAIHRRAGRRAFWLGFALFGWGYLGLIAVPSIEPRLLTTRALAYLDSRVPGRPVTFMFQPSGGPINNTGQWITGVAFSPQGNLVAGSTNSAGLRVYSTTTGRLLWSAGGTTENFLRIGHSLFALILAWLGGKLSRHLHGRGPMGSSLRDRPGAPAPGDLTPRAGSDGEDSG
jgi:hypothetical protein